MLFLFDYAIALLFPGIPKLVVVINWLKNWRINKRPFKSTFTDCINFLVFHVCQNLQQFLSAFWAVVGSIDHLLCVFSEALNSASWNFTCSLSRTHGCDNPTYLPSKHKDIPFHLPSRFSHGNIYAFSITYLLKLGLACVVTVGAGYSSFFCFFHSPCHPFLTQIETQKT